MSKVQSQYPDPPIFYHLYTNDSKQNDHEKHSIWTPPKPIDISFSKLGILHTNDQMNHGLNPNIENLLSQTDLTQLDVSDELRRLNKLLLKQYIDILTALISETKEEANAKVKKFKDIYYNITYLLTILRQHQARQQMIIILRKQIKKRKQTLKKYEKRINKANQFINAMNPHVEPNETNELSTYREADRVESDGDIKRTWTDLKNELDKL
jgi:hypothetical protein